MPQECKLAHFQMEQGFILRVVFAVKLPAGQDQFPLRTTAATTDDIVTRKFTWLQTYR